MAGSNIFVGTLDLLILRAVGRDPSHGYGIGRWIQDRSSGVLEVGEGALYPALHRLERKGWLASDWGRTETGREAKFYSLTAEGRRQLEADSARWHEHARAVTAVLQS
ncbi:MAG: PadR family transcriptional regulator [Thermoanaerobaculia bacterium]|nr:PadR family transcriptional regulator [Thermoanaerobaculia bacterium]